MSNSSFQKSSSLNSISSAPRRPQKLGSVQSIVKDESNKNNPSPFEEITLSDDEETAKPVKCPICSRDMTIWTSSRRDIHKKVCRTKQAEKEKETRRRSKMLTGTIEKDEKILEKRSKEIKESQKSWELSKNNVKFARIVADDEENRKRKRPRSFAVVELAPKKCQCEVLTTLHSRFIDEFHSKSVNEKDKKEKSVTEHSYQMKKIITKLSRFEQLSVDMQKVLDDTNETSPFIVKFECLDSSHVKSQALILKHRTSIIKMHPKTETIRVNQSREVVKNWLTYVFTANTEWNKNEKEGVKELASKYGPVGLEDLINERQESVNDNDAEIKEPSEQITQEEATSFDTFPESDNNDIEILPVEHSNVEEEMETPINYFTTDDPFIGFGKVVEVEEEVKDDEVILESTSRNSVTSTPQKSKDNITLDSFDEWTNQPFTSIPSTSSPCTVVTPVRNVSKPVFGSHVKILKTTDITPMPQFDAMDENELKERMKEIGMRPKGKKAMIQILKKAYTTLHPEICTGTPTIRPLIRTENGDQDVVGKGGKVGRAGIAKTKTLSERMAASPQKAISKKTTPKKSLPSAINDNEEDSDADKTLNISNDERETGKICGDDVGEEDEDEEETSTSSSSDKSKIMELRTLFLTWIRQEQNSVLHEHILSLQPVSLEEMLIRLEKAEGPLGRIGKGKLVKVLEMLKITYQLPQKPHRSRGGFKRRL